LTSKARDRRVQRSQQALFEALTALILEKRYDKITVQEIIDRANVGRSTFYAHYLDKEDLLVKGFATFSKQSGDHKQTASHRGKEVEPSLHTLRFFRHAYLHHHLHSAMVEGGGADLLLGTVRHHLQEDIEEQLQQLFSDGRTRAVPLPLLTNFLTSALIAMATWWLEAGQSYSPEEIDTLFQQLAMAGVERLLDSQ
jgi:AcrR family transcriptional regulator